MFNPTARISVLRQRVRTFHTGLVPFKWSPESPIAEYKTKQQLNTKAWERAGQTKDEYFGKFKHIHAQQIEKKREYEEKHPKAFHYRKENRSESRMKDSRSDRFNRQEDRAGSRNSNGRFNRNERNDHRDSYNRSNWNDQNDRAPRTVMAKNGKVYDMQYSLSDRIEHTKRDYGLDVYANYDIIYGKQAVLSALKSDKRDAVVRLLFHKFGDIELQGQMTNLMKLKNGKVQEVESKHELNLLSSNAVHNGVLLIAKPINVPQVHHLTHSKELHMDSITSTPLPSESKILVASPSQNNLRPKDFTCEDPETLPSGASATSEGPTIPEVTEAMKPSKSVFNAIINKYFERFEQPLRLSAKAVIEDKRYPLMVYLDSISDPHNVGAIIRSVYFLGGDGIILSSKNTSPITPVVAKTSSGAVECIDIYQTDKPLQLFEKSRENGWKIVAATIDPAAEPIDDTDPRLGASKKPCQVLALDQAKELLKKSPVILVLGSEGEGIRKSLIQRSDFTVSIPIANRVILDGETNSPVDSLNVSVASALLVSKFLE
ncbi:RNA methyltransferase [Nadsonia fulvescens var. elongata DSM 6958]|uniref:rRNA methyltransferase 1, mitochondrial n=1 Tax=Nadsonia fulvescens var. elongata DSM 6958 TaxID=857566 RepID=A0A1E3PEQ8_9ASCO|nr:RNA methyltransferase [Nadsonia fulvescens var. elongata DSM 6958]